MKNIFLVLVIMAIMPLSVTSCDNKNNISKNDSNSDFIYFRNFDLYDNGVIIGDDIKYWYDFSTMEYSVLCSKPNCSHKDSTCVAKIVGEDPIIYDGYIYYFESTSDANQTENGYEFYIDSKLNRISLETSEIEEVAAFTDCAVCYNGFMILNKKLYFIGDDMNPTKDEYGGMTSSNVGGNHFLCSVDLKTNEYKNYGSIYDGDKQYSGASSSSSAYLAGYYNSKIYIVYSFMKEYKDVENCDARDVFTIITFEFDPETEEIKMSDLPEPQYLDENTFIGTNYDKNYALIVRNGVSYKVKDIDTWGCTLLNNKLFIYDKWYDLSELSSDEEYCELTEHTISADEYEDYDMIAYYDGCYIYGNITNVRHITKLTEDELLEISD